MAVPERILSGIATFIPQKAKDLAQWERGLLLMEENG